MTQTKVIWTSALSILSVCFALAWLVSRELSLHITEQDRIARAIGLLTLSRVDSRAYDEFLDVIEMPPTRVIGTSGPDYDGHDNREDQLFIVRLMVTSHRVQYTYSLAFNAIQERDGTHVGSFRVTRCEGDSGSPELLVDSMYSPSAAH